MFDLVVPMLNAERMSVTFRRVQEVRIEHEREVQTMRRRERARERRASQRRRREPARGMGRANVAVGGTIAVVRFYNSAFAFL